jgi:hypothetical protein
MVQEVGHARLRERGIDLIKGLPYVLVPRVLSLEEWEKKYCTAGAGEREKKMVEGAHKAIISREIRAISCCRC